MRIKCSWQRRYHYTTPSPDIDILLKTTFFYQIHSYPAQFIHRIRQLNLHHPAALFQPLVVLSESEKVDLFIFIVPVTPDTLKDSGAIVKGMGHNPNLGFRVHS